MPCRVCGEPNTVESHLVPRALTRMVADKEQHTFLGSANRRGKIFDGKGTFDRNLLCATHESQLHTADTYGVEFLRNFHDKSSQCNSDDRIWLTPNPDPQLLVRFVAACVWRRSMSPVRADNADLYLGVREHRLTQFLFGTTVFEPQLILTRQELLNLGIPLAGYVLLEPCRYRAWSVGSWSFTFGSCTMLLNLDYTRNRERFEGLAANRSNPARTVIREQAEAVDIEGWADIIVAMTK